MNASPPNEIRNRQDDPNRPPRREDVAVLQVLAWATFSGLATVIVLTVLAAKFDIGATAAIGISAVGGIVTASIGAIAAYLRWRRE